MKRLAALVLVLTCVVCLVSCTSDKVDKTTPVFETENITRITFYTTHSSDGKGIDVPSEYMAEITTWLGSFTIDEKADKALAPGSNSVSVEIEYADGTVVKNGLSTTKVDGVNYYMKHDDAPECYLDILEQAK